MPRLERCLVGAALWMPVTAQAQKIAPAHTASGDLVGTRAGDVRIFLSVPYACLPLAICDGKPGKMSRRQHELKRWLPRYPSGALNSAGFSWCSFRISSPNSVLAHANQGRV